MADLVSDTGVFDLSGAFDDLFDFERDLDALTGVAVPRAADAMAEAFEDAGGRIEQALSRAARSGKLDFESLLTSILADLARIGTNAVFDHLLSGGGASAASGPPISINVSMPEGADAGSILSAQGQIASALSQAVLSGGRWS